MKSVDFVSWQENGAWHGYLQDFPGHRAQAGSLEDLEILLADRYRYFTGMKMVNFISWEEDGTWLGYLQDFPDHWTQGETFEDLQEHLLDIYRDLTRVPNDQTLPFYLVMQAAAS